MTNRAELVDKLSFNNGWTGSTTIMLFGKEQLTKLVFDSASEQEPVTDQQVDAYNWFEINQEAFLKTGLEKVEAYTQQIKEDIVPYLTGGQKLGDLSTLLKLVSVNILSDGTLAILFDNAWDENGIAILRQNDEITVGPQFIIW